MNELTSERDYPLVVERLTGLESSLFINCFLYETKFIVQAHSVIVFIIEALALSPLSSLPNCSIVVR